ncbi:MAG: tetratricopeptide repeat protein [Deltaproteobacteria bacterium]|nr:tetratricopeptide repeat protein [Deltaproteobacteria bacterium]
MRATMLALVMASMFPFGCDRTPKEDPADAQAKLQSDLKAAAAFTRNNKPKDAEKLYADILAKQPDEPQALAGLARLRLSADKVDEALSMIDKSIAGAGEDAAVHSLRGEILAKKGDHAEAAAAFGKAFTLAPEKSRVRPALRCAAQARQEVRRRREGSCARWPNSTRWRSSSTPSWATSCGHRTASTTPSRRT